MYSDMIYNFDVFNNAFMICDTEFSYDLEDTVLDTYYNLDETINDYLDYKLFSLQIKDVLSGVYPKRDAVIVLRKTPRVLRDINISDLPITITQKHIYTIINKNGRYKNVNYHGLGEKLIKQIPNSIKNPLFILKSQTRDDSILIITKLKDIYHRPVVASIKINGRGQIKNIQIDSNVMTSIYGRNNYNTFIKRNILLGNVLYDCKKGIIKKLDTTDRKQ